MYVVSIVYMLQGSPQENFKAERVGVVCDHINHFGYHAHQRNMTIEGMGAALLKGPGENTLLG